MLKAEVTACKKGLKVMESLVQGPERRHIEPAHCGMGRHEAGKVS